MCLIMTSLNTRLVLPVFGLLRRALSGPYAGAVVPLRTSAEGDGVTGDAAVRPCAAIGPSVEPIRPAQQQDALHRDVRSHTGRIGSRQPPTM